MPTYQRTLDFVTTSSDYILLQFIRKLYPLSLLINQRISPEGVTLIRRSLTQKRQKEEKETRRTKK